MWKFCVLLSLCVGLALTIEDDFENGEKIGEKNVKSRVNDIPVQERLIIYIIY